MRTRNDRGIALVATMLVMMLMAALAVGFTTVVMSDQKFRGIDRDRTQAFYAAHSGIEKMTVDLYNLYRTAIAPSTTALQNLANNPPTIPGISYTAADGTAGLKITPRGTQFTLVSQTNPIAGGLYALKTFYDIDSTARTVGGGEVHLTRRVDTVAIPVFQFGMFSSVDLAFNAADDFDFGGRVHTNGNLYVAQGGGSTLWLRDRVTAVGQVVRKALSNGNLIVNSGHTGTVNMLRAPGSYRALADTEGSVTGALGSSVNTSWPTISLTTYGGYIKNGTTGARALQLPLLTIGGTNTDLIRRPPADEGTTNASLLSQRLFVQTSLRILLSDTAADITTLPGVSAGAPVLLDGNWNTTPPTNGAATYGPISGSEPPIARQRDLVTAQVTGANVAVNANGAVIPLTAAVPAAFRPVQLTATVLGVDWIINCAGRDGTLTGAPLVWKFTGCRTAAGAGTVILPIGTPIRGTINGLTYTTAISSVAATVNETGGIGAEVRIDSNDPDSRPLMESWFWAGNQQVTCLGNGSTATPTANQMSRCLFVSTIPANTVISTHSYVTAGTQPSPVGGFIKIERQDNLGNWTDVTYEILGYGISAPNQAGTICNNAGTHQNAILRIQRLRDNNGGPSACHYATSADPSSQDAFNYWPNTLFDAREGNHRDTVPGHTNVTLGGVMHYVALDVANLKAWFEGTGVYAGGSGPGANNAGGAGYSVYFSDRRNNRNAVNEETGEYGWEDIINPADANGAPNATLDSGEDVNADTLLNVYGQFPSYNGVYNTTLTTAPLNNAARPTTQVAPPAAKINRAIFFRRALKLVNGSRGNLPTPGFTVVSENPVYLQGHYNAEAAGYTDPHVAASVIADAVTMLTDGWTDYNSFGPGLSSPWTVTNRRRGPNTFFRLAIIGGKNPIFPRPSSVSSGSTFGTDGGAHAFLRFLEGDGTAPDRINYRGSLVTFFFSRQATGIFKGAQQAVYQVPAERSFQFDTDFLNPATLPPLTPVFRDIDTLGFSEEKRPGL